MQRLDQAISPARHRLDGFGECLAWLIGLAVFFALCGSRFAQLSGWMWFAPVQLWMFRATLLASLIYLTMTKPRLGFSVLGFWIVLLAHSFANFYWPSLRWGVPVVDYLLHDQVSANYSFDQAKLYIGNFLGWFAAGLAYIRIQRRINHGADFKWYRSPVFVAILSGTLLNVTVLGIQGLYDINFLALASGTAVSAGRAPGLLEDGGASAVVMSSLVAGLFSLMITGRVSLGTRIGFAFVVAAAGYFSSFTAGRVFFLGIALTAGVLFLAGMALVRSSRSLKLAANIDFHGDPLGPAAGG
jgi:hypothetical protein